MISLSFLDALISKTISSGSELSPSPQLIRVADIAVESVLADWERILESERQFGSITFSTPAEESKVNRSLYEIYQKWDAEAEQVLFRTRRLARFVSGIERAEDLEHAVGHVKARLMMTPEMFDRAREQIRQGQCIPMEELRNGLRSRVRA